MDETAAAVTASATIGLLYRLGCRLWGLGFGVWGLGFGVCDLGLRIRVETLQAVGEVEAVARRLGFRV